MDKHKGEGHRARLRKSFINNEALTDANLLELILFYALKRCDTRPLAVKLLEHFDGDLYALFSSDVETLTGIEGIGKSAAELILFFGDITLNRLHFSEDELNSMMLENDIVKIKPFSVELHKELKETRLDALFFESGFESAEVYCAAGGFESVNSINPNDIVSLAVKHAERQMVLIQHHLSDSYYPDDEEINFVSRLVALLDELGLYLKDYIITSSNGASFSLASDYRYCNMF